MNILIKIQELEEKVKELTLENQNLVILEKSMESAYEMLFENLVLLQTKLDKEENKVHSAWGIIANAHNGNWDDAHPDWKNAATKWRDEMLN